MTFKELRIASGMQRKQFAEYFGIPYRTIIKWEQDESSIDFRPCPEYLLELMIYKLKNENLIQ